MLFCNDDIYKWKVYISAAISWAEPSPGLPYLQQTPDKSSKYVSFWHWILRCDVFSILDKELCNLRFSDRWRVWTAVTICLSVMALGGQRPGAGGHCYPHKKQDSIIRRRKYNRKWSHSDKLWQVQTWNKIGNLVFGVVTCNSSMVPEG